MTIRFTKMHALGNHFMVIDAINQQVSFSSEKLKALAKCDTGVGFDQCLLVEASRSPQSDFFYRIFNADGSEVGQCGNGARCLARFVEHYGLTAKKNVTVTTSTTQMKLLLHEDHTVTVDMGQPKLTPNDIPLKQQEQAIFYNLPLKEGSYKIHAISVGNPHALSVVDKVVDANVERLGKQISEHPFFPEQSNVGFMQIIDKSHVRLRVYERGCGETAACGSGAAAAAAIARLYYDLYETIHVRLPGGELIVNWPDKNGSLYLQGPATFVYEGVLM